MPYMFLFMFALNVIQSINNKLGVIIGILSADLKREKVLSAEERRGREKRGEGERRRREKMKGEEEERRIREKKNLLPL